VIHTSPTVITSRHQRFRHGDYLEPQEADAYIKRGMAYDAKGDFQHGVADFGMAKGAVQRHWPAP
jgi:hypothetical protein